MRNEGLFDEDGDSKVAVLVGKIVVDMTEAGADILGKEPLDTFQKVSGDGDLSSVAGGRAPGDGQLCFAVQKDDSFSATCQKLAKQRRRIFHRIRRNDDTPIISDSFDGAWDVSHGKTSECV